MIELPPLAEEVARRLHREGFSYAEAYPMWKWRKEGWPEDAAFFKLVDGTIKVLRALDAMSGT